MVSAKKCYTTFKLETISRLKNKLLTILLFPNVVLQVKHGYEKPVCNCWNFFPGIISWKRPSFLNGWERGHFSVGEGFIFRQRASFLPALMRGGSSKKFHTVGAWSSLGETPLWVHKF